MLLVGYCRVSSDNDRQTLDHQIDALIAAGVDPRHIFQDRASGARDDRPGLKACLDFLIPSAPVSVHSTLVVTRLDRLGRRLPHLVSLIATLQERGVVLRSLGENLDTATASGILCLNVFLSLAQYQREQLIENVRAGVASARRRGRYGGRPRRMNQEAIDAARGLLAQDMSMSAVARALNVPRTTLIGSLARPSDQQRREAA